MLIQFFLFLFLIILLFLISRRTTITIYALFYLITKSRNFSLRLLAVILLLGTIIHEIAHFIFATILRVPTGELSVIPKIEEGNEMQTGKLEIGRVDPFRQTMVGLAPILAGLTIIYFLGKLFLPDYSLITNYQLPITNNNVLLFFAFCYLIFDISSTMFPSKKDLESMIFVGPIIILAAVALYLIGIRIFLSENLTKNINTVLKDLNLFLLITAILDYIIFLFIGINLTLWQKILRRKIEIKA